MTNNTAAPLLPSGDTLQAQIAGFFAEAVAWVQSHWLNILIAAGIAIIIVIALHIVRRWALRLCRRGGGAANWGSIIARAIGKTGNFFMVMAAARLVVGYANAPVAVNATVYFLFTIAAVFQAAIWVREIIFGLVEHRTLAEGDSGVAFSSALGIIRLLVTIALFAIALVVVLSNVGVNVTGLVAGLGVGGIAIGLAAQGIFADLFAALAILFDKPFRVGDAISYEKGSGTVEAIGLKSTRIRGPHGEERIIANKKLLDYEILNNSRRQLRRIKLTFGLIYQTPAGKLAQVPDLLRQVVEAQGLAFKRAAFVGFGANSLDFELEFESSDPSFAIADGARHRVGIAIVERFAREDLEFFAPARPELAPKEKAK